ncbi:anthranilate synthase component II [Halobacteriovorax marinus SJ]|uniref:Anthranilate synthase component II n=1 Tax=Halobacteriovorax marinus (strain ATCC BAA-682 / DSM 15412 / SJ) TaxID=862908 RepID=E1X2D4_HALMS|nr:aminodeoxychorismate/anthranilate synthase component II [Halobacteriovorax marinus]CBW26701.1 anthranilate synthase component II [Halobacteriovorax marinus SJ]
MRVLILDFEDSFTFNIFSTLKSMNIEVEILHFREFQIDMGEYFSHIVLGPGPGHIEDYVDFSFVVSKLILDSLSEKIKLIGICLGHQLIQHELGRSISRLETPIHGQSQSIFFPDSSALVKELRSRELEVQLYNSWAVRPRDIDYNFDLEILGSEGEILASISKNIVTYQFHCESIGTSCQQELFSQILV